MKAIKTVGIVLAVLVALFVCGGLMLPRELEVEESVSIQAPVSNVWKLVGDLRANEQWSPWKKSDPELVAVFSGPERGIGQTSEWNTEKSGKGKQVVSEYSENELIAMDLDFYERGTGKAAIRLETQGEAVTVTLSIESEAENLVARYFQVLLVKNMLSEEYRMGLAELKTLAEAMPVEVPVAAVDASAPTDASATTDVSATAQ